MARRDSKGCSGQASGLEMPPAPGKLLMLQELPEVVL